MNVIDCQLALLFLLIALAVTATLSSPGFDDFESLGDLRREEEEEEEVVSRAAQSATAEFKVKEITRQYMSNFSKLGWTTGCGHAPGHKRLHQRVLRGSNVTYGEFPSFVRLEIAADREMCGGVLISSQHVLTAAHCFKHIHIESADLRLHFGEILKLQMEESEVVVSMKMTDKNICRSPKYHPTGETEHDWLIIEMPYALTLNDYIQPACLPRLTRFPITTGLERSECYVMGFGSWEIRKNEFIMAPYMQKVRVVRVRCKNDNDPSRTCYVRAYAGLGGSACKGDSGGPVLCKTKDGLWSVAGLVSHYKVFWCGEDANRLERLITTAVDRLVDDMDINCKHFPGKRPRKQ